MHHYLLKLIAAVLCFSISLSSTAQKNEASFEKDTILEKTVDTTHKAISSPKLNISSAAFSAVSSIVGGGGLANYGVSATRTATISSPTYTNSIGINTIELYAGRLNAIRRSIPLDYNPQVRSLIELYLYRKADVSSRIIGLSQIYFPVFENIFAQYGLPSELKYLAIPESALNPYAVSRSGAVGLWQLMPVTARELHLTINENIDERRDPYKATHAAAEYLRRLYYRYNDWPLAIAAYNCGPGTIDNAIKKSGGIRDFWLLHEYLPHETRSYVPAYIGATYMMNYYIEHNLSVEQPAFANVYAGSDTVLAVGPIDFSAVTKFIKVSEAELRFLNPAFKKNGVPPGTYPTALRLPITEIQNFRNRRTEIQAYSRAIWSSEMAELAAQGIEDLYMLPGSADEDLSVLTAVKRVRVKTTKTHTYKVKKGESIGKIADRFNCTTTQIKKWNKLKSNNLTAGQKLKIVGSGYTTKSVKVNIPTAERENNSDNDFMVDTPELGFNDNSYNYYAEPSAASSYAMPTPPNLANEEKYEVKRVKETVKQIYTVRKGDNLSQIADKYNCDVAELKRWNRIRGNVIDAGDKLSILTEKWVSKKVEKKPAASSAYNVITEEDLLLLDENSNISLLDNNAGKLLSDKTPAPAAVTTKTVSKTHTVRKGDNLSDIAQKYNCDIDDLKKWNKIKGSHIDVGQKIVVSMKQVKTTAPENGDNNDSDNSSNNTVTAKTTGPAIGISPATIRPITEEDLLLLDENSSISLLGNNTGTFSPNKTSASDAITTKTVSKTHTVRKGDNLSDIAQKYNCDIDNLKKWNKIKGSHIDVGQKIVVSMKQVKTTAPESGDNNNNNDNIVNVNSYASPAGTRPITEQDLLRLDENSNISLLDNYVAPANGEGIFVKSGYDNEPRGNNEDEAEDDVYRKETHVKQITKTQSYTVKKGDNLIDIAKKFNCEVADIKAWNKLKSNQIVIGSSLIIGKKVTAAKAERESGTLPSVTNNDNGNTGTRATQPVEVENISDLEGIDLYDNSIVLIDKGAEMPAGSSKTPKKETTPATTTKTDIYTVKKGDTLWDIVKLFPASSVESLCKLNKISLKKPLVQGTKLKVYIRK